MTPERWSWLRLWATALRLFGLYTAILTVACGGSLATGESGGIGDQGNDASATSENDAQNPSETNVLTEADTPLDSDCPSQWCRDTYSQQLARAEANPYWTCSTADCGPDRAVLQDGEFMEIECYYERTSGVLVGAYQAGEGVVGCNLGNLHRSCPFVGKESCADGGGS